MNQITVDIPRKRATVIGKDHVSLDFLIDFVVTHSDENIYFSEISETELSPSAYHMFQTSLGQNDDAFISVANR